MDFEYTDRMLQIGDYVPACKQANNGRLTLKTKWQENALMSIWDNSDSIDEFAQRAGISINRAISLDRNFSKVFGIQPAHKPPAKRIVGVDADIKKMFGL